MFTVRPEDPAEQDAIADIHRQAFGDRGAEVVALLDALRPAASLSLVAEEDGRPAGHALFTTGRLDAPRRLIDVEVLSPIAVRPDAQGRGAGAALVRAGLRILDERSVPLVFLEGSPDYYGRFGFEPGREYGFRRPSLRIPEPGFQVARLSGYEPWMTGTLVYPDAFWQADAVGLRDDAGEGGRALGRITAGHVDYDVRRATRQDVAAIVALIAADQIGATRDGGDLAAYERAFAVIDTDPAQRLVVVSDATGSAVATLQLTFIPGLARRGALRAQIEAVRVRENLRGQGIGSALIAWAIDEARREGCALVQLTSDKRRNEAHGFYGRLGFVASHEGFKLPLLPGR